jgi:hypothetical protein
MVEAKNSNTVHYISRFFTLSAGFKHNKNESADPKQEICKFCPNREIFNYF